MRRGRRLNRHHAMRSLMHSSPGVAAVQRKRRGDGLSSLDQFDVAAGVVKTLRDFLKPVLDILF